LSKIVLYYNGGIFSVKRKNTTPTARGYVAANPSTAIFFSHAENTTPAIGGWW
jgi:hypothetical protein